MSAEFEIHGADQFLRLSKALKAAGRTGLRKELDKGLRDAAKPLIKDVRAAARRDLPKRGGLNEVVARGKIETRVRTGQATAGVWIVGKGQGLSGTNRGTVRHPVFGNREKRFVDQKVSGGWFDETLTKGAPTVRPFLEQALEAVAQKIVRDAK